jgi:ubiquinone/menaquinone biosynthesis C-methylase UbiE
MSVVEFGCGPGYIMEKIMKHFNEVNILGIEIDTYLVDYANKYLSEKGFNRFNVLEGNILDCNLESNKFDFAIIRLVLEHLPNPIKAALEVYRVLKPGGKAVFIDNDFEMHIRSYPHIPELKKLYDAYSKKRESEGGQPMIGRQLPEILIKSGFVNVDYDVLCAHSKIIGDEAFAKSEGLGIAMKLVKEGYLNSKILGDIN